MHVGRYIIHLAKPRLAACAVLNERMALMVSLKAEVVKSHRDRCCAPVRNCSEHAISGFGAIRECWFEARNAHVRESPMQNTFFRVVAAGAITRKPLSNQT